MTTIAVNEARERGYERARRILRATGVRRIVATHCPDCGTPNPTPNDGYPGMITCWWCGVRAHPGAPVTL